MLRGWKVFLGVFVLLITLSFASDASAQTLLGGAENVNGEIVLVSDATDPFSAVSFSVRAGTTFADLSTLSADFNVTDDDCGGGSPRFSIELDENGNGISDSEDGNIFVAFGPSPNFTDCASGMQNTGNLIGNNDAGRFDASQVGGSVFGTYAQALAVAGSLDVLSVSVVVDASWSAQATNGDGEQTIIIDNVNVNGTTSTFPPMATDKNACKDGGWMTLVDGDGNSFKNQGQCVSSVVSNRGGNR